MERSGLTVGFVGLEPAGKSMARGIADARWSLKVWHEERDSFEALGSEPFEVADTLADLAGSCDLVGVRDLGTEDRFDEAVGELLAAMKPDTILAVHRADGTPAAARRFEETGREVGVAVLDAPLSGPPAHGLGDKWLTMMVGGDRAAYARGLPVFESFAHSIVYVGPPGFGQLAKLLNNTLYAANLSNCEEALELGTALGFDPDILYDLLQLGSGASFALTSLGGPAMSTMADHFRTLFHLQVDHLAEEARAGSIPQLPLEDAARRGADGLLAAGRWFGSSAK